MTCAHISPGGTLPCVRAPHDTGGHVWDMRPAATGDADREEAEHHWSGTT